MDPIAFQLGAVKVHWYGIIMALAYFIGAYLAIYLAKFKNISKDNILDFMLYLIPSAIIGARLGHVIANWPYYSINPINILKLWNGGLAFHTGFFLVIIVMIFYCKKRNIKFFDLADILVIPLALGLAIGRIGNLINKEILGKVTSLPWAITINNIKRHPSQIYELISNLAIGSYLFYLFKNKKLPSGFIFWTFVAIYSIIRFFLDFLKDWPPVIYHLSWAQLFSIPLFIIAVIMLYKLKTKEDFKELNKT
ncbi:MAG: prolipoprotein diacylglyceryl transferase [Nanoarchaeota archaeon]|nr:prolipoprotein diacylglyceryl transferase [Nanoarchaeota archaeon]